MNNLFHLNSPLSYRYKMLKENSLLLQFLRNINILFNCVSFILKLDILFIAFHANKYHLNDNFFLYNLHFTLSSLF